jgi:hypothetical protein
MSNDKNMVAPIPTAAQQAAQKAAEGTMTTLPGGTVRFQQGAPAPPEPTCRQRNDSRHRPWRGGKLAGARSSRRERQRSERRTR